MRPLATLLTAALMLTSLARADDPLVFVSAFASGNKGAVHAFQFDGKTGALKPLHRTTDLQNPFFLAVSPDQRFLYAIDAEKFGGKADEKVAAYGIEGRTGKLKRLNEQSTHGNASCYISVDATGKTVAVANYSSGNVASFSVKADGSLGEAVSIMQHTGPGADPQRQKGPNAHSMVMSPDNRFALAADLGIDKIMVYRLDAATATLTPHKDQPFVKTEPGSGPRHMVFHPNGKRLYVINEIGNSVTRFDYAAETGTLTLRHSISTVPADYTGKSYCADLKITPDGGFLYATNRGHDSIASYRIAQDGVLTLLAIQPSLGKGPQNLLITPDGQWLLCANMPGNSVVVFQIDGKTGGLKAVGDPVSMPMPSCIRWVD
ncbi:MAG: pgl 2 [Verrucomicrobiaceae bacterium]|nr:pgl 2 [Verrucomicrobiaceae bacterium]